jgi:proteasome lid subunit RPN8/RPN11
MDRTVYITENCLAALIASCLETPHKEAGGFLIGKEDKRFIMGERKECLTLDVAYPVRTSKSGKGFWQPSNLRAYNRIIDTIKLMSFNIVGEYHSHIKNVAELSEDDKKFIKEEIQDFEKGGIKITEWIEMVLNIEKKTYTRKPARSCECSYLRKKMRCTVRGIRNPLSGYSITIGTYWFDPETLDYKEANVHIP